MFEHRFVCNSVSLPVFSLHLSKVACPRFARPFRCSFKSSHQKTFDFSNKLPAEPTRERISLDSYLAIYCCSYLRRVDVGVCCSLEFFRLRYYARALVRFPSSFKVAIRWNVRTETYQLVKEGCFGSTQSYEECLNWVKSTHLASNHDSIFCGRGKRLFRSVYGG